jgi:hypothetical protein
MIRFAFLQNFNFFLDFFSRRSVIDFNHFDCENMIRIYMARLAHNSKRPICVTITKSDSTTQKLVHKPRKN